ncbi:MAG: hypothetical protein ACM3ML_07705 [Micromonosporaceae bacterium]
MASTHLRRLAWVCQAAEPFRINSGRPQSAAAVVSFAPEGSGTRVSMEAIPVPWTARVPLLGSGVRTFHHRRFRTALQILKKAMEEPIAA